MNNLFEHKGLTAHVEFSNEDGCFVGRVNDVDGLVMFAGDSVAELRNEFIAAVDEYIAAREAAGLPLEKSFSGTFNVRVGSELHRQAQSFARRKNVSLNDVVKRSLQLFLESETKSQTKKHHAVPAHAFTVPGGMSVLGDQSWDVLGTFGLASSSDLVQAIHRPPIRGQGFAIPASGPVQGRQSWDALGPGLFEWGAPDREQMQ